MIEDHPFGEPVDHGGMKGIGQEAEDEPRLLNPRLPGSREILDPGGQDRQAVPLAGQGEGKGVIIDVGVDDADQGLENRPGGVTPGVTCRDVGFLRAR